MLFNEATPGLINCFYIRSNMSECSNEVVMVHFGHHADYDVFCVMGVIINLSLNNESRVIVEWIEIWGNRGSNVWIHVLNVYFQVVGDRVNSEVLWKEVSTQFQEILYAQY